MRKVKEGTKVMTQTDLGPDLATILKHLPSQYSKDVYLVEWQDGSQTLFELKKENLMPKQKKNVKTPKK